MALLQLEDVSYQQIISNIFLTLDKGESLTLTGVSGGGKSTLLKLIASLVTPTSGQIFLEEKAQELYEYTDYRQQVSYCFQQPTLFDQTVKDNLAFPFLVRNQAFDQAKAEKHLGSVALPASYLAKSITELSGGERQRVALIRNILFPPKILLLDEVTAGLDEQNKAIVHQLIRTIHEAGTAIIQVTHDEEEINAAEKLLLMEGGKLNGPTKYQ